jgi:hypothetical protein
LQCKRGQKIEVQSKEGQKIKFPFFYDPPWMDECVGYGLLMLNDQLTIGVVAQLSSLIGYSVFWLGRSRHP